MLLRSYTKKCYRNMIKRTSVSGSSSFWASNKGTLSMSTQDRPQRAVFFTFGISCKVVQLITKNRTRMLIFDMFDCLTVWLWSTMIHPLASIRNQLQALLRSDSWGAPTYMICWCSCFFFWSLSWNILRRHQTSQPSNDPANRSIPEPIRHNLFTTQIYNVTS